jgi:hypothetical protein
MIAAEYFTSEEKGVALVYIRHNLAEKKVHVQIGSKIICSFNQEYLKEFVKELSLHLKEEV